MFLNTVSGGIDILEVNLIFTILTVRGQKQYVSTHERMFLWKCRSLKRLDLRGTRTPNLTTNNYYKDVAKNPTLIDHKETIYMYGWTTWLCMIVHYSSHILKWELVCMFWVRFHICIITSCHGSRFHEETVNLLKRLGPKRQQAMTLQRIWD